MSKSFRNLVQCLEESWILKTGYSSAYSSLCTERLFFNSARLKYLLKTQLRIPQNISFSWKIFRSISHLDALNKPFLCQPICAQSAMECFHRDGTKLYIVCLYNSLLTLCICFPFLMGKCNHCRSSYCPTACVLHLKPLLSIRFHFLGYRLRNKF